MGQQGVDLAGLRGQIIADHLLAAALVARNVLEQPLELADIAVHGLPEVRPAAIAQPDVVEGALAGRRVELAPESVAVTAIVAIPGLRRRLVIDHARNINGQCVE